MVIQLKPFLLKLLPEDLCILILNYVEWELYDIDFRKLCLNLGIVCYERMEHAFLMWRNGMARCLNPGHIRDVRLRQNGKPPAPPAQWGPTNLERYIRELYRKHIAFPLVLGDKIKILPDDATMYVVAYERPPVGEKVKVTEESIRLMVHKLNTLVIMAVGKECIWIGVIQNMTWVLLVPIPFIHLAQLYLGKHSSKKKAFPMEISKLEKDAPYNSISPKPSKEVNRGKKLTFDPRTGRFIIFAGNGLTIPVHLKELMGHLFTCKEVKTVITQFWDELPALYYFLSQLGLDLDTVTWVIEYLY